MARTRRPLIAGNWKMNGLRADVVALAKAVAEGVKQAKWADRAVLESNPRGCGAVGARGAGLAVAYEPVWAIGTGKTPTTPEVAAAHAHIRKALGALMADAAAVRLLYGGSVKGSNAGELLAAGD